MGRVCRADVKGEGKREGSGNEDIMGNLNDNIGFITCIIIIIINNNNGVRCILRCFKAIMM